MLHKQCKHVELLNPHMSSKHADISFSAIRRVSRRTCIAYTSGQRFESLILRKSLLWTRKQMHINMIATID